MASETILSQVDVQRMESLCDERLISRQRHPTEDLLIWNYTALCQYKFAWDEYTRMCRGLITDSQGDIVARPFPKFHNIEEHSGSDCRLPPLDWRKPFICTQKEDGSLGILYPSKEGWKIATRGSFTSDQALHATEIFRKKGYDKYIYSKDLTYLFEIIYPDNRIVLDYKGMDDLILLEILDTGTGNALKWESVSKIAKEIGCPVVSCIELSVENIQRLEELFGKDRGGEEEGIVVRFEDGTRCKVKYGEYKRLHRLITGCSPRSIWENLKDGKSLEELLEHVPDEFNSWVQKNVELIKGDYKVMEGECEQIFKKIKKLGDVDRKTYAQEILEHGILSKILFQMLDGKNYSETVWKMIKPDSTKPFRPDIDS